VRVHIHPCGDSQSGSHYDATIKHPVPMERMRPFLTDEQAREVSALRLDAISTYGVTAGKNLQNRKQWEDMRPGDIVLLYRQKKVFETGVVLYTFENPELAIELWQTTENGDTWQCMYLIGHLQPADIDVVTLSSILGYKPTWIAQRYQRFNAVQSQEIVDYLDISDGYVSRSPIDHHTIVTKLNAIEGDPSISASVKGRREQNLLRDYLFSGKDTEACAICNKEYPVTLLVAAHIKMRRNCTAEERKNPHVVMPACKFGCDELYEKGYIFVEQGVVRQNPKTSTTPSVEAYATALEGQLCSAWNAETEAFFGHHRRVFRIGLS